MKVKVKQAAKRIPRQSGRATTMGDRRLKRLKTRQAQRKQWVGE